MPLSSTPYTLTAQQLDAAIAALEKASEAFRLSPLEKGLYKALTIAARTTIIAVALWMALAFAEGSGLMIGLLGIVSVVGGLVTLLLLFVNLGLISKTLRQHRLLRNLGLQELSYSIWRKHRKRRWFARIAGVAVIVLAAFTIVSAIGTMVILVGLQNEVSLLAVETGAVLLSTGLAMILWRTLRESRERLEIASDADRLRATLASMLPASPQQNVVVPAAVLEKVASIEQAQIARDRARAVLSGVSSANRGYGVLIAREVSEQKASLPLERRLEVEELIEEMAGGDQAGDGIRSRRTPDGSVEIEYSVDSPNRRIQILAMRSAQSHAR